MSLNYLIQFFFLVPSDSVNFAENNFNHSKTSQWREIFFHRKEMKWPFCQNIFKLNKCFLYINNHKIENAIEKGADLINNSISNKWGKNLLFQNGVEALDWPFGKKPSYSPASYYT